MLNIKNFHRSRTIHAQRALIEVYNRIAAREAHVYTEVGVLSFHSSFALVNAITHSARFSRHYARLRAPRGKFAHLVGKIGMGI